MPKMKTQQLTTAAVVAAMYAVMAIFGSVFGITYGPIQCRFSEALCVLPFLVPETTWGLFVGCLIANILSPYGLLDVVVGSLATLLAALWTRKCKHRFAATLPPVICNMVLVGALIAWQTTGGGAAFLPAFAYNAITVGVGEAVACCGLGSLLLWQLPRMNVFKKRIAQ